MAQDMIVYVLLDPRTHEPRYVGKSFRSAHRRLRRHLAPCYLKGKNHKERWVRLLLKADLEPVIEVLEKCCSATELKEAERFHIAYLRGLGARLTNTTPGGDGGGTKHTSESRKKISQALTGRVKSVEHLRRIALGNLGRRATTETRAKLSQIHSARPRLPWTNKHRVAISRGKGGRPFVDQHGTHYETQNEAARALGLNLGHLNEVLHGKRGHVAGYVFRFLEVLT
jgi:hypothetical protein